MKHTVIVPVALAAVLHVACEGSFAPCRGVTCSGHGVCLDNGTVGVCECFVGYHSDGLDCVADGADGDADGDTEIDADADLDADCTHGTCVPDTSDGGCDCTWFCGSTEIEVHCTSGWSYGCDCDEDGEPDCSVGMVPLEDMCGDETCCPFNPDR